MQTPLDVVDVALDLMRIESTSGSEGAVIAFVDRLLESRGWRTSRVAVTPGRDDLFATATDAPLVTLSTHLDTVPPYIPPARTAERITGRGACDAKGIAAAMICAAERLRDASVPVALLFVVGEETWVLGRPRVRLRVTSEVPSGQIAVRLCDMAPDGSSTLVTRGVLNLSARQGRFADGP